MSHNNTETPCSIEK
jgi:hypothetical protein